MFEQLKKKISGSLEKIKKKPSAIKKIETKIKKKTLSEEEFEKIFWELEITLMESNVAVQVIEKIKKALKERLVNSEVSRRKVGETIRQTLQQTLDNSMKQGDEKELFKRIKDKDEPFTFMFVGVNGVGKTTNLAKFSKTLEAEGFTMVWAAADTFRAAAIHQIQEHASKLGAKLIKHDYGADSAAVGFDAVKHAESKGLDTVLIDTAGRSYSNKNLMDELKKVKRVCKPDFTFLVVDALTGNDAIKQAEKFEEGVGVDGVIIAKSDVDRKGGVIVSVSEVIGKPVYYLGTGQDYDDLEAFHKKSVLKKLGLNA